jgi:hypothetical protein
MKVIPETCRAHQIIWQAKKEILDTELELFNKQQCGEDTIVLRKKLNELTKQVQHYCESML